MLLPGREAASCPRAYRSRRPRESPLHQLVDGFYDEVKGKWEDHFQCRYGFWRGAVEDVVYAFLDCGILDHGFARVRCDECRAEFLVAFSAAHSLAALGAAAPPRHCTAPAGPDFLHHRELLGRLCSAGWDEVRKLMVTGWRQATPPASSALAAIS